MKKIQIIQTPPLAVDRANAAAALGVSETTLEALVRAGELPPPRKISAGRVGWLWRELMEYAETRPVSKGEEVKYPLSHEWHVAVNRHQDEQRKAGKPWSEARFMYEALHLADEVPRMARLFKAEREKVLPQTHQQCSMQAPVPVKDNHLSCCLGVKARECPHLLALEKIDRCTPDDIDTAKAWTCAAHVVSQGGDLMNEGYMLRVDDRMFWDNVYASMAQDDPDPPGPTQTHPAAPKAS